MSGFRFQPLKDFKWFRTYNGKEKLIGHYVLGAMYNCTDEPRHDTLRAKCKEWYDEGKIKLYANQKFVTVEMNKDGNPA